LIGKAVPFLCSAPGDCQAPQTSGTKNGASRRKRRQLVSALGNREFQAFIQAPSPVKEGHILLVAVGGDSLSAAGKRKGSLPVIP